MPSFLSKLLGRKKVQEPEPSTDKRGSPTSLLEGKFEAVSPTVSPSAALFTDSGAAQVRGNDKAKDKESPFNLLRYKSRPSSDSPTTENPITDVPHLSLTLPVTKDRGRALDVVFEPGHEAIALLDEAAIGERRLSPDEALSLVRACSQVIIERGLETLGIMHPHWHSASLEVQHRLISLYILSLASNSPNSVTSPTSPTSASVESELHYARSPHDVGAVLRWGLRHLKLDGASFGKESGDWTWYSTFAAAERTGSFPSDAFSKSLIPQLPPAHSELLLATLDIISSLAAHGEANGSSGSRLSRFLGLWLLTAEHSPEGDDWATFYDRWDRAGRILEHLFLARIRDEAHKLPRRLTELVENYPYASDPDASDDNLLVRPRFSTRDYDALFVRLDTEYIGALKPKSHPLRLIADALRAQSAPESATVEDADLWASIRKASLILDTPGGTNDLAHTEPIPNFSNVFSDETIRLLSLIPADVSDKNKHAPTFVLLSPISPGRPRSFSLPESPRSPTQVDHTRAPPPGQPAATPNPNADPSTAPTSASPETPTDWLQFSSQGFGTISPTRDLVATLWDNDVEVTVPPPAPLSRKSSRRAHSRRSSVDSPSTQTHAPPLPAAPAPPASKATLIARVKLNEAFVDFWADALLDPISKPWLRFVLCQLKPLPSVAASPILTPTWLIIEQRFVRHAPVQPPKEEVETPTTPPRPRASSPRPSLRAETSRLSAALSFSPKMRFGFFTGSSSDPKSPKETSPRLPQVGELGEITKETQDAVVAVDKPKESDAGEKGRVDGEVAATAGAAAAASAVTAAADEEIPSVVPTEGAPLALADETAPSVSASDTKVDVPVGDQPTTAATPQNGHAQDSHIEEQRTPDPETPPVSNGGVHSATTNEPAAAETESPVPEAKIAQPALESVSSISYLAGISEGPIPQPESVPAVETTPSYVEVFAPTALTSVAEEPSTPEPSAVPLVEESRTTETTVALASPDYTFVDSPANGAVDGVVVPPATDPAEDPEPTVEDPVVITSDVTDPVAELPSVVGEPKSAVTSTLGLVPAATEDQPIPALETVPASDVSEPVTSTSEEVVAPHVGETGLTASTTPSPANTEDLSAGTTTDTVQEQIDINASQEYQAAQPAVKVATPVVEEAAPVADAEQPTPVSEAPSAPANEPALADEPFASDKDGFDVPPVVVGFAENFPVAEASVEGNVLKPTLEAPEHLVTKSESESSVAEPVIRPDIARDSEEPLHTNGSAQHPIEEPTTTNASVVTAIAHVDEPVVSRTEVEESVVTPKVDNVEEQLATTSEPEPLVEGTAVPVPEEAVSVVGEPVHPTAVKIETPLVAEEPDRFTADSTVNTDAPTELPTLVAEPAPTADVAPAASILAEAPALAAEEPLPSSQTTVPATADVTTETSISVPVEEPIRAIEAAPAAETPSETLAPSIDEPKHAPQTDAPIISEIPAETPTEEPNHVAKEVTPAAEIPVESLPEAGELDPTPQASASVGEETPVGIPAAAVEEPIPVTEVATLSSEIIVEAKATATDEPVSQVPISADARALVGIPEPTAEHLVPVDEVAATTPIETSALVVDDTPLTEEAIPAAEIPVDTPVPEVEHTLVADEASHAAETPAEIPAPAPEEPDHVSQATAPIAAEPEVLTESLVPLAEEPTPVTEETASVTNTHTENLALLVEEPSPAPQAVVPAELTIETPVPVVEEQTLATEVAPNADTPAETLAVTAEPIPTVAPLAPSETPVPIQAPELPEPTSAPETASHAEALPPVMEAPAEPIPEEHSLVIDDAAETSLETVPPAAEEFTPPVPEETTAETVPDVDVAPVADDPAPTLEQSAFPVLEIPAPIPEEPVPVPEEVVPAVVERSAETTAPVAEGSTITEQATLATIETPAPAIEESTLTTGSPLEADTPAETPAPVPGVLVPVPEESVPEASPPTPDAEEQLLSQKGSAARPTEEYAPPAAEHLPDQPETIEEPLQVQVTEQVVQQEPVTHVDGEAPTEEEPVVQRPESVLGAEIVTAPEVDAPVEAPVSNGTGHEPEQKLEAEPGPAVPDEKLDDAA